MWIRERMASAAIGSATVKSFIGLFPSTAHIFPCAAGTAFFVMNTCGVVNNPPRARTRVVGQPCSPTGIFDESSCSPTTCAGARARWSWRSREDRGGQTAKRGGRIAKRGGQSDGARGASRPQNGKGSKTTPRYITVKGGGIFAPLQCRWANRAAFMTHGRRHSRRGGPVRGRHRNPRRAL